MDQLTVSDVRAIVSEIKPEAVKINGLQEMLRRLGEFFGDEDVQLIKRDLENKGLIHAWDRFLDVLKCAGVDAFKKYIKVLFSSDFKCTKAFQDTISDVCSRSGLAISELVRGTDSSDGGQGIRRLSYDWSSVESNDTSDNVFVSSGATAERRRECYRSTSRNGSYGKQTASSSMGSMDENKALSLDTSISSLSPKVCRLLCERLDHETSLNKDWRRVAECLDMSQGEITKIKDTNMLTKGVITEMGYRALKVSNLVRILWEIGRHDCVSLFSEEGIDLTPLGIETKSDEENPPRSTEEKVSDEDATPIPESTKEADPQVKVKGAAKSFDEESSHSDLEESGDPFQESFNETLKADKNKSKLKNIVLDVEEKLRAAEGGSRGRGSMETYRDTDEKCVAGHKHSLKAPASDQRGRSKSETKDLKGAANSSLKGAKSKSLEIPSYPGVFSQNALRNQTLGDDAFSKKTAVQESECTAVYEVDLEQAKDEELSETGMKEEAPYSNLKQPFSSLFPKQETLSSIEDDKKCLHYTLPMMPPTGVNRTMANPTMSGDPVMSRGGNAPEIQSGPSPLQPAGSLKVVRPKLESSSFKKDVNQFAANNNINEKTEASQNTAGDSVESKNESRIDKVGTGCVSMSPAQVEEDSEVISKKASACQSTMGDSAEFEKGSWKDEVSTSHPPTIPAQEEDSVVDLERSKASQDTTGDSAESEKDSFKDELSTSRPPTIPAQEEDSVVDLERSKASQDTTGDSAESEKDSFKDELSTSRPPTIPAQEEDSVVDLERSKASQDTTGDSAESEKDSFKDELSTSRPPTIPAQEEDSVVDLERSKASQDTTGDSAESEKDSFKDELSTSRPPTIPAQEEDSVVDLERSKASQDTTGDSAESEKDSFKDELSTSRPPTIPAQEEDSVVDLERSKASQDTTGDSAESEKDSWKDEVSADLPCITSTQEEALPFQSSSSLVDSRSLESKEVSSFQSTVSTFISSLLEKVGYGRRPVFPDRANAASKKSPGMPLPHSGIFRQASSNSAVASEHCEAGVGEVGDTSLRSLEVNFVSSSEKKAKGRFEGNSNDQLNEGRFALLINNFDYRYLQKLHAKNFMEDLAKELKLCGWQVEVQSNLSKQQLENPMKSFAERSKWKTALLYYFGIAVQVHGENYILPIDFKSQAVKTTANMKRSAVNLDDVILSNMTVAEASVIIVDAAGNLTGSRNEHGLARVKERRQNQCVLFTSSNVSRKRFMANLLAQKLQESEAITSIRDWIAPFRNDFEAFACSRRLMPLPVKVPSEGWNRDLFQSANSEIDRLAFFSKADANLESIGRWIVNLNKDESDLETDFNIFLKTVDSERLAFYLFYYEGAVKMENGELLLNQHGLTPADRPPSLALILELLSETVLGPRIIIVNSTCGDFDATDFGADQYNLQETFLMVSSQQTERGQDFYHQLIFTMAQENIDIENELLRLSESYNFRVFNNSLFNI